MHRSPWPRSALSFAFLLAACSGKVGASAVPGSTGGAGGADAGHARPDGSVADGSGIGDSGGDAGGAPPIDDSGPPPVVELLEVREVAYDSGRFVAVGEHDVGDVFGSVAFTSADGDSWQHVETGTAEAYQHVAAGNGVILASKVDFPDSSTIRNTLWRSTDGTHFMEVTTLPAGTQVGAGFSFGAGVFAMADGIGGVLTSTDGLAFTAHPAPSSDWSSIAFGDGLFTYVDSGGNRLWVSPDAVQWEPRDVVGQTGQNVGACRAFDRALGVFLWWVCCFGEEPGSNRYGRAGSLDGELWKIVDGNHTPVPMPEFVTDDGCISVEPTTFDTPKGPDTECRSLKNDPAVSKLLFVDGRVRGAGTYVLVGRGGIVTSHDGRTWTLRASVSDFGS